MGYIQSAERKTKSAKWEFYLAKLSFRNGEIFLDKQNLSEFTTTRPALQDMLKVLQAEMKEC